MSIQNLDLENLFIAARKAEIKACNVEIASLEQQKSFLYDIIDKQDIDSEEYDAQFDILMESEIAIFEKTQSVLKVKIEQQKALIAGVQKWQKIAQDKLPKQPKTYMNKIPKNFTTDLGWLEKTLFFLGQTEKLLTMPQILSLAIEHGMKINAETGEHKKEMAKLSAVLKMYTNRGDAIKRKKWPGKTHFYYGFPDWFIDDEPLAQYIP